jgi:flagellar biosynthetic protein FliR
MPSLADLLSHTGPFLLVVFRLGGLFVLAPVLSSALIPAKARALLCFVLALAVYPTLTGANTAPAPPDLLSLGPAVLGETLIGAAIGLIAALPLYAVQLGGLVVSQQAGLALGQVYNPLLDTETDVFGQFLQYAAMVMFVMFGGLEAIFVAAARTFAHVPVGRAWGLGGGADLAPTALVGGLAASGFELALRVAAPVLCIILIETVASALVSKTIPQINTQSIGFAVKVVITILAMVAGTAAILEAARTDMLAGVRDAADYAESLRPGAPLPGGAPPAPGPGGADAGEAGGR